MTDETSTNGSNGAMSKLGPWQICAIGLVIIGVGAWGVHEDKCPWWGFGLGLAVYFVGVGAVVKLLGAIHDFKSDVAVDMANRVDNAVKAHKETTLDALQVAQAEVRKATTEQTDELTNRLGEGLGHAVKSITNDLAKNTDLTKQAADGIKDFLDVKAAGPQKKGGK